MADNRKRKLQKLETGGIFFIFITGILLHFLYDFSQKSVVGILFGCVNGSVWEHCKVFALTFCIWTIIELACSINYFRQFVVAKVFVLYLQCGIMITVFWGYYGITGKEVPITLISPIAFGTISICQCIGYLLIVREKDIRDLFLLAAGFLFLFFMIFFCFSVVPPHIVIFQDPLTHIYGIIPKNIDVGAYFMNNTEV